MSDKLVSLYAIDDMLSKLSGMYHIEDIRGMISRMPGAEVETYDASNWVSVGERLPPKDRWCIFCCDISSGKLPGKSVYQGKRVGDYIPSYIIRIFATEFELNHDGINGEVTHWMLWPEPIEGGQ